MRNKGSGWSSKYIDSSQVQLQTTNTSTQTQTKKSRGLNRPQNRRSPHTLNRPEESKDQKKHHEINANPGLGPLVGRGEESDCPSPRNCEEMQKGNTRTD